MVFLDTQALFASFASLQTKFLWASITAAYVGEAPSNLDIAEK
jgi:hypothetical protein